MKTLTNSFYKLTVLAALLTVVLTVNYLRAWTGPTTPPPPDPTSTNVAAPLNVSGVEQTKVGNLNLNGGVVANGGVSAPILLSTGGMYSDGLAYYFGATQNLSADGGSYGRLIWNSAHADRSQMEFMDVNGVSYGKVFGGSSGAEFGLRDGDNQWSYLAAKDVRTQFLINNDPKMTILADGKVGIGTDAPQSKLHVEGDMELKNSNPSIKFNDTDSGQRNWQLVAGANNITFKTDRDANGTFDDNPHPLVISNGTNLSSGDDDYGTFANEVRANEYCDRSGDNCINPASLTLECVSGFRKDDTDKGIFNSTLNKTYAFGTVFDSGENNTGTGDQPWLECKNEWVMTGCSSGTDGNVGGGDNDEAMRGMNECRGDQIGDNKISARCCRISM